MPDTPIVEPIQNLVIDDIIAQVKQITVAAGGAMTLNPREPLSMSEIPEEHGETLIYDGSDKATESPTTQTQQRELTVVVEIRAVQSKNITTPIRRLLRRAWADVTKKICAGYGRRVRGVGMITAGDVILLADDNANAATAFCEFIVTLETVSNDPFTPR